MVLYNINFIACKLKLVFISEVQQPKVLMSTTGAKLTAAEPKITVTVDDAPVVTAKKRPAKMTMSLSERFASETVSQPKVTAVALKKKKEAQTSTVQVLTKTSTEKMDSIEKGKNWQQCKHSYIKDDISCSTISCGGFSRSSVLSDWE